MNKREQLPAWQRKMIAGRMQEVRGYLRPCSKDAQGRPWKPFKLQVMATICGISKQTIERIVTGDKYVSLGTILKICDGFGLNVEWLIFGRGKMTRDVKFVSKSALSWHTSIEMNTGAFWVRPAKPRKSYPKRNIAEMYRLPCEYVNNQ